MEFSVGPHASLVPPLIDEPVDQRHVLVCQNRTCTMQGAAAVLAAFQAHPVAGCSIMRSGCMGQCGNGPMVHILPDNILYCRVTPREVTEVIERHLKGGRPVKAMLSPDFHANLKDQQ